MKKLFLLGLLLTMCFHYVKAQEVAYRPIVEEGKVWKVGWIPSGSEFGNVAQVIAYFWLDYNDLDNRAIINQVSELRRADLMKEYVCNDLYKDLFPSGAQNVTYLVEHIINDELPERFVNYGSKENPSYGILYCFDQWDVSGCPSFEYFDESHYLYTCCVLDVTRGTYDNGFKGLIGTIRIDNYFHTATFVFEDDGETPEPYFCFETKWLEGVGSVYGPYPSIIDPRKNAIEWYLMECRVGDDVLYYNPDIIDGVNPPDDETKKRIDFTHIEKPRPRAPHRAATEESVSLSGEFSARLLDLQLGDMSDTYNVTIIDDADEVVYQKTVRAADVLALNIDISEWAAPSYTINVENDYEQYVGTFELTPTSIEEKYQEQSIKNNDVYDLQGRRLIREPAQGLYIKNGRKYLKK